MTKKLSHEMARTLRYVWRPSLSSSLREWGIPAGQVSIGNLLRECFVLMATIRALERRGLVVISSTRPNVFATVSCTPAGIAAAEMSFSAAKARVA